MRGLGAKLQQHVGGDQEWTLSCARLELTNSRVGADGKGLSRLLWSDDARKAFPSAMNLTDGAGAALDDPAPQFNLVYSTETAIDRKTVVVSLNGTVRRTTARSLDKRQRSAHLPRPPLLTRGWPRLGAARRARVQRLPRRRRLLLSARPRRRARARRAAARRAHPVGVRAPPAPARRALAARAQAEPGDAVAA